MKEVFIRTNLIQFHENWLCLPRISSNEWIEIFRNFMPNSIHKGKSNFWWGIREVNFKFDF
jgi:hypothetical protein